MFELLKSTLAWMPGNARAAVSGGKAIFETTTLIVLVVLPILPVEVTMTWQLASCVGLPGPAPPHGPVLVSRLNPVRLSSLVSQSLRTLTVKVPCALPRPGRFEVGAPRIAPRAHVAPARESSQTSVFAASCPYAYSMPASATYRARTV